MDEASLTSKLQRQKKYLRCSSKSVPCPQALGYIMGKTLGSGKYAKVKAAWSPFERQMIAIKIINKAKVDKEELNKFLPREITILQKVSHPHIIGIFQIVETERKCFFATEIAENGNLLDYMNCRYPLLEGEARHVFVQVCQAISYCHSIGIAHRDIKLENIFFDQIMDVKVGDFGFSLESRNHLCCTPVGSNAYKAPEIMLALVPEFDPFKADSWSMGVLLYSLVMKCYPFGGDGEILPTRLSDYHNLQLGYNNTEEYNHLVRSLLAIDPTTRPLISDISSHVWLTDFPAIRPYCPYWKKVGDGGKFTTKTCLPPYLQNIVPRYMCNSSSPLCYESVASYPRLQFNHNKDIDAPKEEEVPVVLDDMLVEASAVHMEDTTNIITPTCQAPDQIEKVTNVRIPTDSMVLPTEVAASEEALVPLVMPVEAISDEVMKNVMKAATPTVTPDQVENITNALTPTLDDEPVSSLMESQSDNSVVSVHVFTTAPPMAVESSRTDTVDSQLLSALHAITSPHGQRRSRRITTQIKSAGRRFISFMRRIRWAKSSS